VRNAQSGAMTFLGTKDNFTTKIPLPFIQVSPTFTATPGYSTAGHWQWSYPFYSVQGEDDAAYLLFPNARFITALSYSITEGGTITGLAAQYYGTMYGDDYGVNTGPPGMTVPPFIALVGGQDPNSNLQPIATDTAGHLVISAITSIANVTNLSTVASLSTITQGNLSTIASLSSVTQIGSLSTVGSITTPVQNYHGGKKTFAVTTSVIAGLGTGATGTKQLLALWHSSTAATRAQLERVIVSMQAGAGGTQRIQIARITTAPAGTSITVEALDQGDAGTQSAYAIVASITASVTMASTPFYQTNVPTATAFADTNFLQNLGGNILEGKPPVLRASNAEGWVIAQVVDTSLTTAANFILGLVWTEQ
jgi:hypothetical protein